MKSATSRRKPVSKSKSREMTSHAVICSAQAVYLTLANNTKMMQILCRVIHYHSVAKQTQLRKLSDEVLFTSEEKETHAGENEFIITLMLSLAGFPSNCCIATHITRKLITEYYGVRSEI
jgi:hypothetical protein